MPNEVPAPETLRQRLDQFSEILRIMMDTSMVEYLKKSQEQLAPLETDHLPLDLDVFALDNSDTKKEGVFYTYRGVVGYSHIGVWLGIEG